MPAHIQMKEIIGHFIHGDLLISHIKKCGSWESCSAYIKFHDSVIVTRDITGTIRLRLATEEYPKISKTMYIFAKLFLEHFNLSITKHKDYTYDICNCGNGYHTITEQNSKSYFKVMSNH